MIRAEDFPTLGALVTVEYNQTALTIDTTATSYDRARRFCDEYPDLRDALHAEAVELKRQLDDPMDVHIIFEAALSGEFGPRSPAYAGWLQGVIDGSAPRAEATD